MSKAVVCCDTVCVIAIVVRTTHCACASRDSYRWNEGIVDVKIIYGIGGLTFVSITVVLSALGGWRRVARLYVDYRSDCEQQANGKVKRLTRLQHG